MRTAVMLLSCALLMASGRAREPTGNVVLVVIDTLRANHMSLYGYERPTTPRLEELAGASINLATESR